MTVAGQDKGSPMAKPSKDPARLFGRTIKPGDFAQVDLKISETVSHQPARIPVMVLRGQRPGPVLSVVSALHGNEINGVAIVRKLLETLDGRLERGTLIAVPVANRFGFDSNDRYLPDRRDLNRHFPGEAKGNMAHRIAHQLFTKVVLVADGAIDLHTAADGNTNLCHIRGDADIPAVKDLMRATGLPILVHGEGPKGSLRRAATEAKVPSILFEAGEPSRFQRHVVDIGHHAVLRLLSHLGMTDASFTRPTFQALVRKSEWIRVDHGGILDLRVEPGDLVAKGEEIGAIYDPYGRHVDHIESDRSGVVLGIATDPLANPGNAVVHIGEMERTLQRAKDYVKAGGDLGHVRWKPQPDEVRKAAPGPV
jgi:uncharacterized protein